MTNKTNNFLIFCVISSLLFSVLACSIVNSELEDTTTPIESTQEVIPQLTKTIEIPATETIRLPSEIPPTETATAIPSTEIPQLSHSELIDKWRPPIAVSSLVYVTCEAVLETADKRQNGEIDGFDAFTEILASGIILKAMEEGLAEWNLSSQLNPYKQELLNHIAEIQSVLAQWIDEEIDSADIQDLLIEECNASYTTMEDILQTAKSEGLEDADVESIVEAMQENISEITEDIEGEEGPSTEPSTTPVPEVGFSRSNPYPISEIVAAPNWDIEVLEIVRGDDAWVSIQNANPYNSPPPEEMEYILVKLHVKCTYDDSDSHNIGGSDFKITGSNLIEYSSDYIVVPEPELNADLFTDGEAEGWSAFIVGEGEGNLILIFDEIMNFEEERRRYIGLDENTSIVVHPDLGNIQPNDLGRERDTPAPLRETVVTEDWIIRIENVIRGDDAWTIVQEANEYNDPPPEGMEYIAVFVYVQYIGTADEPMQFDSYNFNTSGSMNVLYDLPSVVDPSPELSVRLFPGGEYEGWFIGQVALFETNINSVFEPWLDFTNVNKRFLALEP